MKKVTNMAVWSAIDAIAKRNNLSPSGLARKAGLDPTAFNPSKRNCGSRAERWPTMKTIAVICEITGTSMVEFARLVEAGA